MTALAMRAPAVTAALWMGGAIASFSIMAVAGRELSAEFDTFEIMLYRSLVGMAAVVSFGLLTGRMGQMRTARPGRHLVRNLFHFTGQNLWFAALPLIPLAQLFALEFSTPIWVALAAPLVLAERLTPVRLLAAALGFAGVLVVARPGVGPVELGHAFALLASFAFAANVLTTKLLSRTETIWTIMFWMTVMQTGMGLLCAGFDGDIALPDVGSAPLLVIVGLSGLTAHLCLATALSLAPASTVAPMDFLRLPVIAVVGMLVYGEALEVAVFAGAAMILAGNLVTIRAGGRAAKAVPVGRP